MKNMRLKKIIVLGLGTALALGIGEIGSRVYTSSGTFLLSHNPVIQKQTEGTDFFEPDDAYGHVLKNRSFVGSEKLESLAQKTLYRVRVRMGLI